MLPQVILHGLKVRGGEAAVLLVLVTSVEHLLLGVAEPPVLLVTQVSAGLEAAERAGAHRGQRDYLDVLLLPLPHH